MKFDKSLIKLLKTQDSGIISSLECCNDVKEAWKILSALDQKLSVEIQELDNRVDGQKLLDELHRYNEIKDSAQIVIGSLANVQGVTVAKLHTDLNLDSDS